MSPSKVKSSSLHARTHAYGTSTSIDNADHAWLYNIKIHINININIDFQFSIHSFNTSACYYCKTYVLLFIATCLPKRNIRIENLVWFVCTTRFPNQSTRMFLVRIRPSSPWVLRAVETTSCTFCEIATIVFWVLVPPNIVDNYPVCNKRYKTVHPFRAFQKWRDFQRSRSVSRGRRRVWPDTDFGVRRNSIEKWCDRVRSRSAVSQRILVICFHRRWYCDFHFHFHCCCWCYYFRATTHR